MASSLAKDEYKILIAIAIAIVLYGIFLLINEISIYQPAIPHLSWTFYRVVLAIIIIYVGLILFKLAKGKVSTGKPDSLKAISFISIASSFVLVLLPTSTFVNLLYTTSPMYDMLFYPVYVHGRTYDNLLCLPSEDGNLTFNYAQIQDFLFIIPSPYGEVWFWESYDGNPFKFQRDSDYLLQWSYEIRIRPYFSFMPIIDLRDKEYWIVEGMLSYGKTISYVDLRTRFSRIGDARMAESYLKLVLQDIVRDHIFVFKDIFFRPAKLTYYGKSSSISSGERIEIALIFIDDNGHTYEFDQKTRFGRHGDLGYVRVGTPDFSVGSFDCYIVDESLFNPNNPFIVDCIDRSHGGSGQILFFVYREGLLDIEWEKSKQLIVNWTKTTLRNYAEN